MHGHYGPTGELLMRNNRDAIPDDFTRPPLPDEAGVRVGGQNPLQQAWMQGGDASTVVSRARQANIGLTVVSPLRGLMPRGVAAPHTYVPSSVISSYTPSTPVYPQGAGGRGAPTRLQATKSALLRYKGVMSCCSGASSTRSTRARLSRPMRCCAATSAWG
jgi:hypothetical protein